MPSARVKPTNEASVEIAAKPLLVTGELPIEELAFLAAREGKRPRPIYGAHKWFARRAGSSFRALLIASAIDDPDMFWPAYYGELDLQGLTVLDPFVGGGTSVVEARRLGADAIGVDIDSIACAVTAFETVSDAEPDPLPTLAALRESVEPALSKFYETTLSDGEKRDVLHFFWVQTLKCGQCRCTIEAHPHYRLAHESEGTHQWVFCPSCDDVHRLPKSYKSFTCKSCDKRVVIDEGPEARGEVCCGQCGHTERLIDAAQRHESRPTWKLFAIESIPKVRPGAGRVHLTERKFSIASDADRRRYARASKALRELPVRSSDNLDDTISTSDRSDDRLVKYGYSKYRDLFNDRQLLHLNLLVEAIDKLPEKQRRVASLAFSDHLTKNCMQTCYAFGWRRLVPLFAFRAFRHVTRPVEVNPWLAGVGRGTYPNAIKQSAKAIKAAKNPTELLRDGGEIPVPQIHKAPALILNAVAQDIPIADSSVDVVMTDPPYFDNIDYSELADFYRPWMDRLGMLDESASTASDGKSLAAKGRGATSAEHFAEQLEDVSEELSRVLRPDGRVAFTFRHNTERGWTALSEGIRASGKFRCVQVFPMLAEGSNALHTKAKSGVFDAVFVLEHGVPGDRYELIDLATTEAAARHAADWQERLTTAELPLPFRDQDATNFRFACRVAASLGMFT